MNVFFVIVIVLLVLCLLPIPGGKVVRTGWETGYFCSDRCGWGELSSGGSNHCPECGARTEIGSLHVGYVRRWWSIASWFGGVYKFLGPVNGEET